MRKGGLLYNKHMSMPAIYEFVESRLGYLQPRAHTHTRTAESGDSGVFFGGADDGTFCPRGPVWMDDIPCDRRRAA